MSIYIVGDVQGCLDGLRRLLDAIRFDPGPDFLILAGDLVNRGPDSLKTLRFVRGLGASAEAVLGNHDLHLLALAHGLRRGKRDTMEEILEAPDREELLDWLRQRPLLLEPPGETCAVLHAGLPPQWTLSEARTHAREAESCLRSPDYVSWLQGMYGDEPDIWDSALSGVARFRFIINCFTRLRYCDAAGRLVWKPKGPPGSQAAGLWPWFAVPGRRAMEKTLVFGHWSTLGQVEWPAHRVFGLDTGCVWGGRLTALRVDDFTVHSVGCEQYRTPEASAAMD